MAEALEDKLLIALLYQRLEHRLTGGIYDSTRDNDSRLGAISALWIVSNLKRLSLLFNHHLLSLSLHSLVAGVVTVKDDSVRLMRLVIGHLLLDIEDGRAEVNLIGRKHDCLGLLDLLQLLLVIVLNAVVDDQGALVDRHDLDG